MPTIEWNQINWLAVIAAALAAFVIAGIWYSALFATAWTKAQGWTDDQAAAIKARMVPAKFFGGMIASYLVLAFAIAVLASKFQIETLGGGVGLGLFVWLAIAAVTMTHHLASGRVIAAYLIDAACELIYVPVMGLIIGAWR
ncbi:MAG: DUF1761 domain-containing protein [Phycisphaerales bacterium]|nr:DUF1761 domain-containing protein [Phycisphaerales bacterium]MCI0631776.1 DUF1761 domain-containing protein [Phycisphaerales bacterium]MCI0677241.1 DUF1761 domain-containing protein [Phycisphaerales bacterium]